MLKRRIEYAVNERVTWIGRISRGDDVNISRFLCGMEQRNGMSEDHDELLRMAKPGETVLPARSSPWKGSEKDRHRNGTLLQQCQYPNISE